MRHSNRLGIAACALLLSAHLGAQVTYERILRADQEPGNWLTYNRTYDSRHHSPLDEINRDNAGDLELKWVFQADSLEKFESTALAVDGVIYNVQMPNDVVALDAVTGRKFWQYTHVLAEKVNVCCGRINRGLAILGETLYMGTIDGKLVALDAKTGAVVFSKQIVDPSGGYSLTHAPLVVKDKLIVGSAGGEYGIRGFIAALDPKNGDELWRFNTIPGPGEPGHETWSGDSWKRGGGSIWLTGSYDPELNLTYWGVGNPAPDWNGDVRLGDNLYSDSVVALNPDTGELEWYFQFTPHDEWDWDAVQVPVLVDREWEGKPRKLMLWANRNGFFYVLDRATGEFLHGKNFVKVTWAKGLDENGRPIKVPEASPTREGVRVWPAVQGGTNWYSPAYSEKTGLFYVSSWEYSSIYHKGDPLYTRGNRYVGSLPQGVWPNTMKDEDEQQGHGAIRALSPDTGDLEWEFKMTGVGESGILSTAGDILVTGTMDGYMLVLDSFTGKKLLSLNLGGTIACSPITFTAQGKQYLAVTSGNAMFVFGLR